MEKEKKEKYHFSKKIRITEKQIDFIKKEQKKLKYKTMAGTLDLIINKYKQNDNSINRKITNKNVA